MNDRDVRLPPPPPVAALASWILPGLGYWLIGEKKRGVVVCVTVLLLYVAGLLIGGVRVVDVPGFDAVGNRAAVRLFDKPWYIAQFFVGPVNLGASVWSVSVSDNVQRARARIGDIGTLYTAVAGALNLILIIDTGQRSMIRRNQLMEKYPHLIG